MRETHERGGGVFSAFLTALFLSIVCAGIVAFAKITNINPLNPSFLESAPPSISLQHELLGLGADPVPLKISVNDDGSGLDEVLIRISQNNEPKELARRRALGGSKREDITLSIDPKELGLREGKAELQVSAFDQSLWSNGSKMTKSLVVDFLKPRIDVITPQQNAVLGGSELVFYKVLGKQPTSQGVVGNGTLYPGFPAKQWDPSFKNYDDLYLAFFPIPQGADPDRTKLSLLARDDIGNSAEGTFNYRIRTRRWGSFQVQLSTERAEALKTALSQIAANDSIKARFSGDLATDLKQLVKVSLRLDESVLSEPLSQTEGRRLWSGAFQRPVSAYPVNTAGDTRTITVAGHEILKSPSTGSRFQVPNRSKVAAANNGRVVFVDTLPTSGTTIIIDHGFGLATVYAHLSAATAKVGEEVTKGATIGQTGTSGLAGSEEVFFEMRLHGVPVSPNEWWDESWIKDHVQNKVAFVQTELIGAPGE